MYATVESLLARIGSVYAGLYAGPDGEPLVAEATADLASASAEIDLAVAARYATPVTSPESLALLTPWCLTLAEELAWTRSGVDKTPENIKQRVANVRRLLDLVAEGKRPLPGAAERASGVAVATLIEGARPLMTREEMAGY